MSTELTDRLAHARAIAHEAGQLTLRYFQTDDLAIEQKSDFSPVTVADRQAEQLLRACIAERFANDGILGEEFPEQPGTSGYRWILDPIDGTRSFVRGVPLYGTMVAVERDHQSVVGVVYLPALDECMYAALGQGAWHQRGAAAPRRARVSTRQPLSAGLLSASDTRFPSAARQEAYKRLQQAAGTSRTWGDCYGYLLVATGRAEVMIDPIMNVWDTAAVAPIVVEAGGTFTDWQGQPTIYGREAIATNGLVLDEVLAITRGT
jgi:histidinol phosphatase-like enzyme (inositol monophosphatase family)